MSWRTRRAERRKERDRLSGWNPRRGVYEKGGLRPRGVDQIENTPPKNPPTIPETPYE